MHACNAELQRPVSKMPIGNDFTRDISKKYCAEYGRIAVEMGLISERQLALAFERQRMEVVLGRPHRLVGQILFSAGLMSSEDIELVLKTLFRGRAEERH